MKSKKLQFLAVWFVGLFLTLPAFAGIPTTGTVVEGHSIPGGVELGFTRAQVEETLQSIGDCWDIVVTGDQAFCTYAVEGVGSAILRYEGADGGNSSNSSDDVLYHVSWTGFDWITTAGLTYADAVDDPNAITVAYPNAEVTVTNFNRYFVYRDAEQGIQIIRSFDGYVFAVWRVRFDIFQPEGEADPGPI